MPDESWCSHCHFVDARCGIFCCAARCLQGGLVLLVCGSVSVLKRHVTVVQPGWWDVEGQYVIQRLVELLPYVRRITMSACRHMAVC